MEAINVIVAASNWIFGYTLLRIAKGRDYWLVLAMIMASTLMHISETKHRLPGIYPFNLYAWHFLQLDQWLSYFMMVYGAIYFLFSSMETPWMLILLGVLSLNIAERVDYGEVFFMVFHVVWHYIAYRLIEVVLVYKAELNIV